MKLSECVKEERLNKGLTQKELAKKLKITRESVIRIESGKKIGNATIKKLAKFLKKEIYEVVEMIKEEEKGEGNEQS